MATLFLGLRFLVMFVVLFVVMFAVVRLVQAILGAGQPKKQVRNFKTRFDPVKKKYYIVNELPTRDDEITNWLGRRILYANQAEADFIVQKLNVK